MYARGSRYEHVPEAVHVDASGRRIPYTTLRLAPPPGPSVQTHVVVAGDRLDRLAHAAYGDPLQFWRIADANRALLPEELVAEPGTRLVVPLGLR